MARYNFNASGYAVVDETYYSVGSSEFILGHDMFLGASVNIYTGPGNTGVNLVLNTDFQLNGQDSQYTTLAGANVYTKVQILNASYQTWALYISYTASGDYVNATTINNLTSGVTPQVILHPNMTSVWPWLNQYRRSVDTTLSTGENVINAICYTGSSVIAGLNTSPAKIVRLNSTTNAEETTLNLDTGENICKALTTDGTYVYAGLGTNPAKIIKINPATMARVPALTLATGENDCRALAYDGTYLYAILGTDPCKVVKINPSTMAVVGSTLTLAAGESTGRCGLVAGDSLFVGTHTSTGKIVKINLSTFTKTATLTLAAGENTVQALGYFNGTIYCGLATSKIAKVNPVGNMSELTAITITAADTKAIITDGVFVYFTGWDGGSDWKLAKYEPRAGVLVSDVIYPDNIVCLTYDGISIFGGSADSPGIVYQRSVTIL